MNPKLCASDLIKKALIAFMAPRGEPFYSAVLMSHEIVADNSVRTACIDGVKLRYNEQFVEAMGFEDVVKLLAHEAKHIALGHPFRVPANRTPEQHHKWNIAGDLAINALEDNVPENWLLAGRGEYANFPLKQSMEAYFKLLKDNPQGGSGGKDGKDGMDGEFAPCPNGKSEEELKARHERMIINAASVAKNAGKCPAWVEEIVDSILKPPQVDWKTALRDIMTAIDTSGFSYERPNRRSSWRKDVILPVRSGRTLDSVAIVCDTSGSMSQDEMNLALSEMNAIASEFQNVHVDMIHCDADVAEHKSYGMGDLPLNTKGWVWKGRGGTDMAPAFKLCEKLGVSKIICVTDGCMKFPEKPTVGVVWLMTGKVDAPYGNNIRMNPE